MILKTISVQSEKDLRTTIDDRLLFIGKIIALILLTTSLNERFILYNYIFISILSIYAMIIYFKNSINFWAFIFLVVAFFYLPFNRMYNPYENDYPISETLSIIINILSIILILISIIKFKEYVFKNLNFDEVDKDLSINLKIIWIKTKLRYIIRITGWIFFIFLTFNSYVLTNNYINILVKVIIGIGGIIFFYIIWLFSKDMSEKLWELFFLKDKFSLSVFRNGYKDFKYYWSVYFYFFYIAIVLFIILL